MQFPAQPTRENVGGAGEALAGTGVPYNQHGKLFEVLKEEWEGISKAYPKKLVHYTPKWCADVIAKNGCLD
jgi:hypothetical protein